VVYTIWKANRKTGKGVLQVKKGMVFLMSAVLTLMLSAAGVAAATGDISEITATGLAMITGDNTQQARNDAILDAKRNAVDQVGSEVLAKTVVENFELVKDQIISRADGYVHGYDILDEARKASDYRVKIKARVSSKNLINDATLIYDDMQKPRVMIIVPEVRGKSVIPTSQAENMVMQFFLEKGFSVIDQATAMDNIRKDELRKIADGDTRAAAKVGLRAGAEAVVTGTAALGDTEMVRGVLHASKATVSLRAIRADNAGIYAVATNSKSEADATEEAAIRKSLSATSTAAAKDIFWKVVKKWNDELNMGADIEVILSGVAFSQLKRLKEGFWKVAGVSDVIQRSFDSPTAVFSVTFGADSMRLAELIDSQPFEGMKVEVVSVSAGKLSLNVK
jgi:hypothetical protein